MHDRPRHPRRRRLVQFTDPVEFVGELARDVELVERGIVRVSFWLRHTAPGTALVSLVAAALVGGDLVECTTFVGEHWGAGFPAPHGADVVQRADALGAKVVADIEAEGLDVRAGRFGARP